MKRRKLITILKGGLGNQLFQYAAARAIAERNGYALILDTQSGFIRDVTYRRSFSLGQFALASRNATALEKSCYWIERAIRRASFGERALIRRRPWGIYIDEGQGEKYENLAPFLSPHTDVWMEGYWQSEKYFVDFSHQISNEIRVKKPPNTKFKSVLDNVEIENCVAIGVRLYEEVPPKPSVLASLSFYERAARKVSQNIRNPIFFIFCTVRSGIDSKLNLPGEIRYVTRDDGYDDELQSLWLLSQFKHHVISNSSFYWWGAWLAERNHSFVNVVASDLFANRDCVPDRWAKL